VDRIKGIHHRAAITGQVIDAQTKRGLQGIRVEITRVPTAFTEFLKIYKIQYEGRWEALAERPDRTHTAVDGSFRFRDLPAGFPVGEYTLTASLPEAGSRYGKGETKVTLARDTSGRIIRVTAALVLPPTTIKGKIVGQTQADNGQIQTAPLQMAEVKVKGGAERTFSDAEGKYLLMGLEVGLDGAPRRVIVTVSAQGFQPATQDVPIAHAGSVQNLDVVLTRPP
jgi:hypothetical protein